MARTITGAYVTTSIDAASTLANIPPIDLLIREKLDADKHRNEQDIEREGIRKPKLNRKALKDKLETRILTEW